MPYAGRTNAAMLAIEERLRTSSELISEGVAWFEGLPAEAVDAGRLGRGKAVQALLGFQTAETRTRLGSGARGVVTVPLVLLLMIVEADRETIALLNQAMDEVLDHLESRGQTPHWYYDARYQVEGQQVLRGVRIGDVVSVTDEELSFAGRQIPIEVDIASL